MIKEINSHVKVVLVNLFVVFFLYVLLYFNNNCATYVSVLLTATGLLNIYYIYKKSKILISPITIFSLIWLVFISLTSGAAPLMEPMSFLQWHYYLIGCFCFFVGTLLALSYYQKKAGAFVKSDYSKWVMSSRMYNICMFILITGIFLYLIQAKIGNGFPIFSVDSDSARRSFFIIPGAAFASNLGFLSIFLIFCDEERRKKKSFWLFASIYLIIQILMTVRFLLILVILTMISSFSEKKLTKKQIRILLLFITISLVAFIVVTMFRGGIEDKQNYFINTGIYSGTANELVYTELVRYFGMSQRTMESYMNTYKGGISNMGHTFFPILDTLGISPFIPEHYGTYGYTACNIITYFYFDAGVLWWLLMIIWSFLMNVWYYGFKFNPTSIFNKYLWGISALGVTMSFYCYINSYTYWYFHYMIMLFIIKILNNKGKLYYIKKL